MKKVWIGFLLSYLMAAVYAEPFVIARVGDNPKKVVDTLKPVAQSVLELAGLEQFNQVDVQVYRTLEDLVAAVKQGQVHWVSETAYAAAIIHNETNLRAYLRRHKKGVGEYGSALLAKEGIADWPDLIGKTLVAEDDGSFSGYFLVYRELIERGIPVYFAPQLRSQKSTEHVNIVFSQDEENSWAWLSRRLADAAIFSSTDLEEERFLEQPAGKELTLMWASPLYPRAVELFSSDLGDETIARIISALNQLAGQHQHPVLRSYEKSYQFDDLQPTDYQLLDEIYRFVVENR